MKKIFIFKTLDAFFRLFIIFLVAFVWIRYFIDSFWISLVISILTTFAIDIIFAYIKNKKQNKLNIKKEKKKKIDGYMNSFIYCDKKYCIDFFYKLCSKNYNTIKKSKYLIISHPETNIILYPIFLYRPLNIDDVIECYNSVKKEKPKRIVICTNSYDSNVLKFSLSLGIETLLLDKQQTYISLLEKYDIYPKITKINNSNKITFKQILLSALDKKRAKAYFVSALFLLFSSLFVYYKIYYLIFSTLLLIMCLLCLFSFKFNKPVSQQILD